MYNYKYSDMNLLTIDKANSAELTSQYSTLILLKLLLKLIVFPYVFNALL